MTDKNSSKKVNDKLDDDLSDLLDSALEDFTKEAKTNDEASNNSSINFNSIISQTVQGLKDATDNLQEDNNSAQSLKKNVNKNSQSVEELAKNPTNKTELQEAFSTDFIRQMEQHYGSNLSELLSNDLQDGPQLPPEQFQQKLEEMAEAAMEAMNNPTVSDNTMNFASIISQSIQGLNEGTGALQNPLTEENLLNMFGGDGGGGNENPFLPFMQGMMQSLLSKDVLYPSLQAILGRFPDWIEANRDKLSPEDIQRHESQINLMKEVCQELKNEQITDSMEVKKQRFEKVLELMQQMQNYGEPPKELMGDMPTLPDLPDDQCSLM